MLEGAALRAIGCSGWSLFRDRATCLGQLRCQGQNFFLRNPTFFFEQATCLKTSDFFEQATCPGQLRCLGHFVFQNIFFEETTCLGQLRCLGPNVSQKFDFISRNALSEILRLRCAEQHVGNIKNRTSKNSGTPVRRTKRRKYQTNARVRNSQTPVRRTERQKSQKLHFREFWDSCAQTKTSEI